MGIKDIDVNDYIIKPPNFSQPSPQKAQRPDKSTQESKSIQNPVIAPAREAEITFPASYVLKHFVSHFTADDEEVESFETLFEEGYVRPEGRPSSNWPTFKRRRLSHERNSDELEYERRHEHERRPELIYETRRAEVYERRPEPVIPHKRPHEEPDIDTLRRRRAALVEQCRDADDLVERNPHDLQLRMRRDTLVEQLRVEDDIAFRKRDEATQRIRYDNRQSYENRPPAHTRPVVYDRREPPRRAAERKTARFFLVAATAKLAELAKTEGTWALPHPQAQELSLAFSTHKVFLIFQGEESDTLLGYAQVEGDIGAGLRPTWIRNDMPFMPINFMKLNTVKSEIVNEIIGLGVVDVLAEVPAEEAKQAYVPF